MAHQQKRTVIGNRPERFGGANDSRSDLRKGFGRRFRQGILHVLPAQFPAFAIEDFGKAVAYTLGLVSG
jgi:hypothetical protein